MWSCVWDECIVEYGRDNMNRDDTDSPLSRIGFYDNCKYWNRSDSVLIIYCIPRLQTLYDFRTRSKFKNHRPLYYTAVGNS